MSTCGFVLVYAQVHMSVYLCQCSAVCVLLSSVLYIRRRPASVLSPSVWHWRVQSPCQDRTSAWNKPPLCFPSSFSSCVSCLPRLSRKRSSSLPSSLSPFSTSSPSSLLSGPLSLPCLLPLSIYLLGWKTQWRSTCEGAFLMCIIVTVCLCVCVHLCIFVCTWVFVCASVSLYMWLKYCWL